MAERGNIDHCLAGSDSGCARTIAGGTFRAVKPKAHAAACAAAAACCRLAAPVEALQYVSRDRLLCGHPCALCSRRRLRLDRLSTVSHTTRPIIQVSRIVCRSGHCVSGGGGCYSRDLTVSSSALSRSGSRGKYPAWRHHEDLVSHGRVLYVGPTP